MFTESPRIALVDFDETWSMYYSNTTKSYLTYVLKLFSPCRSMRSTILLVVAYHHCIHNFFPTFEYCTFLFELHERDSEMCKQT